MRHIVKFSVSTLMVFVLGACAPDGGQVDDSADAGRVRLSASNSYAQIGNYVVHVNAMTSAGLTPEIASNYGIVRSEDTALINLVVLRKTDGPGMDEPVKADVQLQAKNLNEQIKSVELSEIADGTSIYYIGQVPVENREIVNFDFDIRPADADRKLLVRFTHEFYTR